MLSLTFSAATLGIDGYVVRIEADSQPGTAQFVVIGLPDRALAEAKERVRGAILNSNFTIPAGKILVNLSPADVRKEGPAFDLPIALALLGLDEQISRLDLQSVVAIGELSLDGSVRAVNGIFPMVLGARNAGFSKIIVPRDNAQEAALVPGIDIYPVDSLRQAAKVIAGKGRAQRATAPTEISAEHYYGDFADVRGQAGVKRVLEIAAAGGHHTLMIGPPGSAKTMLARRMPSIMPPMTEPEMTQLTAIYSAAGLLGAQPQIMKTRPFRFPHFTIAQTALCGGGGASVKPGEMTLASSGTLYLDELNMFTRSALDALRQPLEEGVITIARANGTFTFPARFAMVASMHACPCGYRGTRSAECRCDDAAIAKHLGKISGPLMDRLDLQIEVSRVPFDEMVRTERAERSATIRERVVAARNIQTQRFAGTAIACNAEIPASAVRQYAELSSDAMEMLAKLAARNQISARALDRLARVARTIADLSASPTVETEHVAEAALYRNLDKAQAATA